MNVINEAWKKLPLLLAYKFVRVADIDLDAWRLIKLICPEMYQLPTGYFYTFVLLKASVCLLLMVKIFVQHPVAILLLDNKRLHMVLKDANSELTLEFFEASQKLVGERIRQLWEESGDLQAVFAKKLRISTVTLANYMNGKRKPDSEFLLILTKRLNIRIDWLLTGDGPMRIGDVPQAPQIHDGTPAVLPAGAVCARCAKLEAELEEERKERRELSAENRQGAAKIEQLLRENGEFRERCAKLEARQVCCAPEKQNGSAYFESA